MCSTKEGEDPLVKIRDVRDSLSNCNWNSGLGFSILGISCIPADSGHANSTYKQEDLTSAMFNPSFVNAESSTMHVGLEGEVRLPSKLILSCVSTLLIIQVHLMFRVLFRVIAAYIYLNFLFMNIHRKKENNILCTILSFFLVFAKQKTILDFYVLCLSFCLVFAKQKKNWLFMGWEYSSKILVVFSMIISFFELFKKPSK